MSAEPLPCLGRRSLDARAPGSRDPSTRPPHPHPSRLPRARSFRHEGPRRLRVGGGALELPTTPRPNLCEDRTLRKEPPPSPPESRFRSDSRSLELLPGLPDWEREPFPPAAAPPTRTWDPADRVQSSLWLFFSLSARWGRDSLVHLQFSGPTRKLSGTAPPPCEEADLSQGQRPSGTGPDLGEVTCSELSPP